MAKLYFGFQLTCSFLWTAADRVLEDLNFVADPSTLLTCNHVSERLEINQVVLLASNEKAGDTQQPVDDDCMYTESCIPCPWYR